MSAAGARGEVRTTCGRTLTVGRLQFDGGQLLPGRVSLDVGAYGPEGTQTWAALTAAEARRLAADLLSQAAEVDRESGEHHASGSVEVLPADGEVYAVTVRGHELRTDQPVDEGGDDTAPTPVELFVASLASCVAFYAGRFLDRHGVPRAGLKVVASFTMADDRPARVTAVRVQVTAPEGLPPERGPAFQAVISHCTVHNTLRRPAEVQITVV